MDFPADITLRKTRMKFELTFKVVLLFSYQGFVFSFENAYLYYHISKLLSRTFFKNFFFFIFQIRVKNITEKEGFEPSHRANDLHP